MDPHETTHHVVAAGDNEDDLAQLSVRAYVDRKFAEGKAPREAIRSLTQLTSNTVCRHPIADARSRAV